MLQVRSDVPTQFGLRRVTAKARQRGVHITCACARMRGYMCVHGCMCACVHVCMCACAGACACGRDFVCMCADVCGCMLVWRACAIAGNVSVCACVIGRWRTAVHGSMSRRPHWSPVLWCGGPGVACCDGCVAGQCDAARGVLLYRGVHATTSLQ